MALTVLLGGVVSGCRTPVLAEESRLVDDGNLLSAATRERLNALLGKLERDTDIKLRVICPPPGLQQSNEKWRDYLRPISKRWGLNQSSVVIVADEPAPSRSQIQGGPKQIGWVSITAGSKLQERFQYTFTKDYILRTASAFGGLDYVRAQGIDAATRGATENIVAALYDLLDRRATSLPRVVRGLREPIAADEVAAILQRHAA